MVTVYLAAKSPTRKAVETAIPSNLLPQVELKPTKWDEEPKRADMVLTTNKLGADLERWAARHFAFVVVLPEAGEYLAQKVTNALENGTDLVLLDARLAKVVVS